MIIGVPKEIKKHEYRVAMTPSGVGELRCEGHTVIVESGAGEGSGFADDEYLNADADIADRNTTFASAELVVKVKEPLSSEYKLLKEGGAIFTYLHLAANPELTDVLLKRKITALAYETLRKNDSLPLLVPMSAIAGRMAPLMGAFYLQRPLGGDGVLPTGTTGVQPAKVVILGAGVVGANAARVCAGLEMETVVINRSIERLEKLDEILRGRIRTLLLNANNVREEIRGADIVIGAVLVPGGKTPVLITREMLGSMKKGAVIVDVSVDQGGCAETSRPTTHDQPVYDVEGIIHYMVANMPGAYPRTSTLALSEATLPYVKILASMGVERAVIEDSGIKTSLNTYGGKIAHEGLAKAFGSQALGLAVGE
ncbi:MAG TPA: alanine dehydrogenase [Dissulfurispiraceae bacterium]|nr:alanine dehydrogenase [Dissulfurispiraceae bacterium]